MLPRLGCKVKDNSQAVYKAYIVDTALAAQCAHNDRLGGKTRGGIVVASNVKTASNIKTAAGPAAKVREGEKYRTWYRNDRIYKGRDGWYFHTREGVDVGPFKCEWDAELEQEALVRHIQTVPTTSKDAVVNNFAISARNGSYVLGGVSNTDYLVEEGGVELLRKG